jgi:hypothetical protein
LAPTDLTYRRRIEARVGDGVVAGAMEDYIHHVAARIHHDGGVITAVDVAPERMPWSSCPVGVAGLGSLVGTRVDQVADLSRWIGSRAQQCVHTTDLAVVLAAAALRGADRTYEFTMEGMSRRERVARLLVDGAPWATWVISREQVVDPERSGRFAGLSLDRVGFSKWIAENLSADEREPAFVMRRASTIGLSRGLDIDSWPTAVVARPGDDSCHTYRPEVVEIATRNVGTMRETDADPVGTPIPPARRWIDTSA